MTPNRAIPPQAGFTLVEVLIALLVLAVGLLGLAMLQTMNVRFTQSANYRTQAVTLADSLIERARIDRAKAAAYKGYSTALTSAKDCTPTVGAASADSFLKQWRCQLGRAIGSGTTANVTYASQVLTVKISWNDERWVEKNDEDLTDVDEEAPEAVEDSSEADEDSSEVDANRSVTVVSRL